MIYGRIEVAAEATEDFFLLSASSILQLSLLSTTPFDSLELLSLRVRTLHLLRMPKLLITSLRSLSAP